MYMHRCVGIVVGIFVVVVRRYLRRDIISYSVIRRHPLTDSQQTDRLYSVIGASAVCASVSLMGYHIIPLSSQMQNTPTNALRYHIICIRRQLSYRLLYYIDYTDYIDWHYRRQAVRRHICWDIISYVFVGNYRQTDNMYRLQQAMRRHL